MKICLLIITAAVTVSGCSTYQYVTIDSKNITKDENFLFVDDTDSLKIEYNFSGYYGPVSVTIFNKTNKPLFVDWSKSAIIINNKAMSYYTPGGQITGRLEGSSYQLTKDWSTQQSTINAALKAQAGIDFIPPTSYRETRYLQLTDNSIEIPSNKLKKVKRVDGIYGATVMQADFSSDNSPFSFRSYITFITDDNKSRSFSKEHSFYISQIFQTSVSPRNYYEKGDAPGNRFYINKISGFGKTAGILAGVGVLTVATAASVKKQQDK